MSNSDSLQSLDRAFERGNLPEVADQYADRGLTSHVQHVFTLSGKPASRNLSNLRESLGPEGDVEVLAQRYIEEDDTSVTLFSLRGGDGQKVRSLLLIARRFDERGKVVEEEYLPIASTADAQAYFPNTPLPARQVKPRLSFITATRKRKSRAGRKLGIRVKETDLHRIPRVGKTVLDNLRSAGVQTFQQLAEASDEVLEGVRAASGRALRNFDYGYWREVGRLFVAGELTEFPEAPRARGAKTGKRAQDIDYQNVREGDLDYLPRVGAKLLAAMHAEGIYTFAELAAADDETLERLREPAGRPFVNFDMTYFRRAAQAVVDGSSTVPPPPSPQKAPKGRRAADPSKFRNVNPNDLHILPGVGTQLIAALHDAGINTFTDVADADEAALLEARSKIRGKYKNLDLGYLRRQAQFAEAGEYERFEYPPKIEKSAKKPKPKDLAAAFLAKLRAAGDEDISVFDGIGRVVREALAGQGITKISELAEASEERLREALASAGPRFAGFRVDYWTDAAKKFVAGDLEAISPKAPKKDKPKKGGRKVRARKPKDHKDLQSLPNVGTTVAFELKAAGLDTFEKVANASDAQLSSVRANSGPRYKNFDVAYWRTVAGMAAAGDYAYPGTVAKDDAPAERRQRPLDPTKLKRLPNVGQALADSLRDNGLKTWNDIVDAEDWQVMKAIGEAGKRKLSITPHDLIRSAKDALQGKFPERKKRAKKEGLPDGYDDFTRLKGVGLGNAAMTRLHEAGIKTYKDLGKATIAQLESIREGLRGRAATADVRKWREVGKLAAKGDFDAAAAYAAGETAPAPEKKRPAAPSDGDDLSAIKGIRHKDQQLLRSRGVKTYAQLAALDEERLGDYLYETGAKLKNTSAATIQEHARRLANGADPKSLKKSKQ